MPSLKHAAHLAGLAITRPVEFSDRLAGRRERAAQAQPAGVDAETVDPVAAAHDLVGADTLGCCGELHELRTGILDRLTGVHHHDGGTSLAELLWVLTRHRRPAVVVETGVARGVSSAFILDALERNGVGRLWSIDLPPVSPDWGNQTGIAVAPEVRHRWTYVRGAARRRLPGVILECDQVGLFVHDGLHTTDNVLFELRTVWPHVEPAGLIVVDDADHNDAVATFAAETGVHPVLVREPVKGSVVAVFARGS